MYPAILILKPRCVCLGQRMQEAINNIRSMGFNYETQLLRELLMREKGDIASVLETILNNSGKN